MKTRAESRIERLLEWGFAVAFTALWLLGALFVFRLRPASPDVGMSAGRWLAMGLPHLGAGIACAALLAQRLRRASRATRAPRSPLARGVLGIAALLAVVAFAQKLPDAHVSVLFWLVGPALLALAWSGATDDAAPLLAALPLLGLGVLLFVAEVSQPSSGRPSVRWGDEQSFASLFPRTPPLIGPGGRLRPDLDVPMASKAHPQGVRLQTEASGFRNGADVPPAPEPGERRILSLGDSVSTGMQIDQGAFFGVRLEQALSRADAHGHVRVLNAEVSDPAYGLHYLQTFGAGWQPSLVIYGLSGNDAMQAAAVVGPGRLFTLEEGRLAVNPEPGARESVVERYADFAYPVVSERALADAARAASGSLIATLDAKLRWNARKLFGRLLRFRLGRLLERPVGAGTPVRMHSFATRYEHTDGRMRLVDGSANLGAYYLRDPDRLAPMHATLFALLDAMDRTARAMGSRFVVVRHPQRYQVHPRDWEAIRAYWQLDAADFDLRRFDRALARHCDRSGIAHLDLLDAFASAGRDRSLYLPRGDMHPNEAGHAVAAEALAAFLTERGILAAMPPAP